MKKFTTAAAAIAYIRTHGPLVAKVTLEPGETMGEAEARLDDKAKAARAA